MTSNSNCVYFVTNKGLFTKVTRNSKMHLHYSKEKSFKEVDLPHITVSMPVYKTAATIKKAVKYILRQTYPNFSFLVISDCDPDDSIIKISEVSDPRMKIIKLDKNVGRYAVDHLVVTELSKSEYWVPVDSDDWCEENYLSNLMKIALENPGTDVVFAAQYADNSYSRKRRTVREWDGSDNFVWHAFASALWRRDFLVEMNLTNPHFRVGWDSIVTSVPWVVGNVKYTQTPMYHAVRRPDSLTQSKETGFGSQYRNNVKSILSSIWKEIVKNKDDREKIKEILLNSRFKN